MTAAIHREGQLVTLRQVTTTINPNTGASTTVVVDDDVTAVVRRYREDMIDGSVIRARDLQILVAAEDMENDEITPDIGPEPKAGWKALVEGLIHHVVFVDAFRTGGVVAKYRLQARP